MKLASLFNTTAQAATPGYYERSVAITRFAGRDNNQLQAVQQPIAVPVTSATMGQKLNLSA